MQGVELRTSYCEGSLKKQNNIEVQLLNGESKKLVSSGSLEGSCSTTSERQPESPLPLLANSIRSHSSSSWLSEHVFVFSPSSTTP